MSTARKPRAVLGRFIASDYQPTALRAHVYAELRRALLDGVFVPGETLSLRSIADALGTSPMPVREAVGRLVAEGALEISDRRTIALPFLTREQFEELSELRIELEGSITERSVRRNGGNLAPALEELEQRSVVARRRSLTERLALNRQFHFTIYRAAGCELRLRIIELLWLQSASLIHMSLAKASPQAAGQNHRALIAAVKAGDPLGARRAVEADIDETYQHLLAITAFPTERPGAVPGPTQPSGATSAAGLSSSALGALARPREGGLQ